MPLVPWEPFTGHWILSQQEVFLRLVWFSHTCQVSLNLQECPAADLSRCPGFCSIVRAGPSPFSTQLRGDLAEPRLFPREGRGSASAIWTETWKLSCYFCLYFFYKKCLATCMKILQIIKAWSCVTCMFPCFFMAGSWQLHFLERYIGHQILKLSKHSWLESK